MRAVRLAYLPGVVALGIFAEWAALRRGPLQQPATAAEVRLAAADLAVGLTLAGSGALLWARRPETRTGPLLAVAAIAWFLGSFAASGDARYADFGSLFLTLHRGLLAHALIAYPRGRVETRAERAAVCLAYALSLVPGRSGAPVAALALGLLVLVVSGRRFARVSGPERRARATALAAAGFFAAVLLVSAVTRLAGSGPATDTGVLWAYQAVVFVIAAAVALDLVLGRWVEATVVSLVVDLGEPVEGGVLRRRLASALGDPSLVLAYRVGALDRYVDEHGRGVTLPAEDGDRRITFVREGGEPVAALVHTESALAQPELVQSVAAAARIAVANARLQAEVQRQIAELAASRRRVVEAADTERRRLEGELREGAERTLGEIERLLGQAASGGGSAARTLAEIRGRLQQARHELREFARGMHPRSLTAGGLARALRELAEESRVAVALTVEDDRFSQQVEAAAYFVCSETLANVGKYASAANVAIHVARQDDTLVVSVSDDGRGGAAIGAGSGLRGLADRVEALGGQFKITSPRGRGTRVVAELPLE